MLRKVLVMNILVGCGVGPGCDVVECGVVAVVWCDGVWCDVIHLFPLSISIIFNSSTQFILFRCPLTPPSTINSDSHHPLIIIMTSSPSL